MTGPTAAPGFATLLPLAAGALGLPPAEVRERSERLSFTALGGSSLQALRLVGDAARAGADLPLHRILGREPVAAVLRAAGPPPPAAPPPDPAEPAAGRAALPGQTGMLGVEDLAPGAAYHLLFTAEVDGAPASAVPAALTALVERHEGLRTVFLPADPETGRVGRRIVPYARPVIRHQNLRISDGTDPVAVVHTQLAGAGTALLRPYERPPVHFTVTRVTRSGAADRLLVSVLAHHALLDAWSFGVLFDELAALLAGQAPPAPAPSPESVLAAHRARTATPAWQETLRDRADRLRSVPHVLELPGDVRRPARWEVVGERLPAALGPAAARAWRDLARATGTTGTAVLLAAYALVLARRSGARELLVGVPVAGRRDPALHGVLAPCSNLVPVACVPDDTATVTEYVTAVADALADAVAASDVPVEDLVPALGVPHDRRRNPLVQFVLGAHDDLVPERVRRGGVTLRLHEGHCHGAPFDATLYVQRTGDEPRLVLEYAHGAFLPDEAHDLLDAVEWTLQELAGRPAGPLAGVRTISPAQQARLDALRTGPALPPEVADSDLWSLVLATARAHPDAPAVRDGDTTLTYTELVRAVTAQAAALTEAGVTDGDPVLLALERGAQEIVAVLSVLAVGAHYVAIDPGTPDERLRTLLRVLPPAAVLAGSDPASAAFARRAESACPRAVRRLAAADARPASRERRPEVRPPAPRGDRVAYTAFTSGSTGLPKAVRVPHRAVARLVWPSPGRVVSCGPGRRMLRLAPLAFDASTLEVFAPLVAGGCVEVHPPGLVTPAELARFLLEREVDVLWLTAGLFRLMADFAPHGFARASHVLAGGDVVPPEQVRDLLTRYPGLRVTNGYGPTENTTFSTVAHFDDPSEAIGPLPIGTPLPGSGALVLDASGRPVPPGGTGELYVTGLGLALDYAGDAERTADSFRVVPAAGERAYRTGDLVRLTGTGQLRFLGRADRQVKIRGYRVELDEIRLALAAQPGVKDAAVVAVGPDAAQRRLVAGVVPDGPSGPSASELAARLSRILPGYCVPALWSVLDTIPLTTNGKVDAEAVAAGARPLDEERPPTAPEPGPPAPSPERSSGATAASATDAPAGAGESAGSEAAWGSEAASGPEAAGGPGEAAAPEAAPRSQASSGSEASARPDAASGPRASAAPGSAAVPESAAAVGPARTADPAPDPAAALARLAWTKALGRPPSGPDAEFFRSGGDSLAFARLLAWLTREHGVRVAPRELYASPTFRTLSELIRPELTTVGGRPS
ncbi:amino acid adenylation domain-containing protein [Streptomyces sp. NPDC013455]|uniref:amino acid adenylation domain-containing protein n=1 Tax=Streptomyces sp. NPDC013455 TaxID=3155605 RepID=UPI0033D12613